MRRRTDRQLSEDDLALWEHVTRGVRAFPGRRLPAAAIAAPLGMATAESAAARKSAQPPAPPSLPKPALKPLAPIERRVKTALKRGQEAIHAVLDLHGMRQDDARLRLISFLRREQASGGRTVLVVTGKGAAGESTSGSERGVLRRMTPHWLRLPELRTVVLGFEEASLRHGGAGALYVRLRKIGDTGR